MLDLTSILHSLAIVNESAFGINVEIEPVALALQLLATLGLFLIIKIKAWPKIKASVVDRAEYINETLTKTETELAKSKEAKEQHEAELSKIRNEKRDIIAATQKEANKNRDITIQESKIRGREIIEKSMEDAKQSKVLIEEQIQKEMMIYVNEVAAKFISEKISSEEELKMIEDAVEGLR